MIYIEVLILLVIFIILSIWFTWFSISREISRRRYKPENDRGLKGEENRKRLIAEGKSDPAKSIINDAGLTQLEGHSILPTTEANDIGKADNSIGKTSKSNGRLSKRRNTFRRRNPFRRKR